MKLTIFVILCFWKCFYISAVCTKIRLIKIINLHNETDYQTFKKIFGLLLFIQFWDQILTFLNSIPMAKQCSSTARIGPHHCGHRTRAVLSSDMHWHAVLEHCLAQFEFKNCCQSCHWPPWGPGHCLLSFTVLFSPKSLKWTLVGVTQSLLGTPWESVQSTGSSAYDQSQALILAKSDFSRPEVLSRASFWCV